MNRNQSLDVLRGIAVLLVVADHYPLSNVMKAGYFGVDLFFVLSGFLIGGLLFSDLQAHGRIRIGRFYFRRALKIYPAFYVFLIITALLWPALRSHVWIESAFLQNYVLPQIKEFPQMGWSHLWSLAVEEHFYLALPLVLIVLASFKRLHWIPRIAVGLCAFDFVARIVSAIFSPPVSFVLFRSHLRADALFAGVALAYLYHYRRESFALISKWWLLPIGLVLLVSTLSTAGRPMPVLFFSGQLLLNLLGFASILAWAVTRKIHFVPLEFIGHHSYSIYLWHTVSLVYFLRFPITPASFAANLICALILGIAMAKLIEFPALKLRDRSVNAKRNNPLAVHSAAY